MLVPMIKQRLRLFCASLLLLAGCVSPPKGWSSKSEIEQTVARNIQVGDSKEKVQEFLTREGIKWGEMFLPGPKAPTPHAISASVMVGRQWPVIYEVLVSFSIGKDGKVDRIEIHESATGP